MKNQHTPGLWTIQPDPEFKNRHPFHDFRHITNGAKFDSFSESHGWVLDKENGEIICDMRDGVHQAANACLVAAAPELLEALIDIEVNLTGQDCFAERVSDSLKRARSAIAKAKGGKP